MVPAARVILGLFPWSFCNLGTALTAASIVGRTDMAMIEDVLTIMSSFFCICKKERHYPAEDKERSIPHIILADINARLTFKEYIRRQSNSITPEAARRGYLKYQFDFLQYHPVK